MTATKRVLVWTLCGLLTIEFILAGASKFGSRSPWLHLFALWGFAPWFAGVVGAVELLSGLALLLPRARGVASAVLLCVMGGAIVTHLAHHELRRALWPAVLFALLAWLRRQRPASLTTLSS